MGDRSGHRQAAVWYWVSTGHQDSDNQIPDVEKFAAHHGYEVVATYRTADSAYKGGGGREFVRRLALVQARVPLEAVGHPTAHVLGRRVAGKVLGGNPLPSVLRRLPARGPLGAPVAPRLPFGEALKHNLGLAHRLRPARAVADLVVPDRLQELAAVGGELVGASSP